VALRHDAADDVVQTRAKSAAGDDRGGCLWRIEEDLLARARGFEAERLIISLPAPSVWSKSTRAASSVYGTSTPPMCRSGESNWQGPKEWMVVDMCAHSLGCGAAEAQAKAAAVLPGGGDRPLQFRRPVPILLANQQH
jgi:hypothetical protein